MAAIRKSRSLFWMLLRERHMFTRAQAPTASTHVQRSVGGIRDAGTMVEKRDSARGDYRDINQFRRTRLQLKHMRTCLNDPPEYGSTPWRNRYMPSCTRWWCQNIYICPDVQSALTDVEKKGFCSRREYEVRGEDSWLSSCRYDPKGERASTTRADTANANSKAIQTETGRNLQYITQWHIRSD